MFIEKRDSITAQASGDLGLTPASIGLMLRVIDGVRIIYIRLVTLKGMCFSYRISRNIRMGTCDWHKVLREGRYKYFTV
jgi:hypothetical protein